MKVHQPAVEVRHNWLGCSADTTVDLSLPPSPPPERHGERPVCDLCAKMFSSQKVLKRHWENIHHHSGIFLCRVCDWRFYRNGDLRKHHIRKHATEEYEAPASHTCPLLSEKLPLPRPFKRTPEDPPSCRRRNLIIGAATSSATCPASLLLQPASGSCTDAQMCVVDMAARIPEDCRQWFIENWSQIRSHQWGGKCVLVHTQWLEAASNIGDMLQAIFCS